MAIDDVKKALSGMFFKDISRFEPGKKGFVAGDNIRVYEEQDGSVVIRFLRDTPYGVRKQLADRLALSMVDYKEGEDFTF